ncbi:MAG: acyl-CoA dehydrogenase family protein [Rhodococcus sp. (in: high G+C Gram-positive bacteria)]
MGDPSVMAPVAEREELRTVLRKLLDEQATHDDVRKAAESERGYSESLWSLLHGDLGVGGMTMPESAGGAGFGLADLGVVLEESGRALLCEPIAQTVVAGQALAAAQSAAGVLELLNAVTTGELIAAVELGGSSRGLMVDGDSGAVSGSAPQVAYGAIADLLVTVAHDPEGAGLYVLDLRGADVDRVPLRCLDSTRPLAALTLRAVPALRLAGDGPELPRLRELITVCTALEHVGMIDRLVSTTREYLLTRNQFGRPLGSFQAIKHRMADLAIDLERARSSARYASAAWDDRAADSPLAAAVASAVCTDAVVRAAHEAIQLHGGVAFTWEHEAHFYLRRALGDEGRFGSARVARARIAELVGV